jgi:uncharacterized protein
MNRLFELKLEKGRMSALLDLCRDEKNDVISIDDLTQLLTDNKIIYGVKRDVLELIATDPHSIEYPIVIAEGKPSVNGEDAYLRNEVKNVMNGSHDKFNFRVVMQIPSVTKGQLLATVVPAGEGVNGKDVTGLPLAAKQGRPLRIKAGKNVMLMSNQFYSLLDGQLSMTNKSISVNPVFEVKGDLDLKTGNLDFVGSITINGNVPSGYELKAGGDICVYGLVEGATLQAAGNIMIHGGVAGGMRANISSGGNVLANYLSQASVKAGQDVIVKTSILHSRVNAGGNVDCKAGTIIGGMISAGRNISVKALGNELFTKTELAVGWDPMLEKTELETMESIENAKVNIKKLTEIEGKLTEIVKQTGKLTEQHKQMIQKQRATRQSMENSIAELMDELLFIQAEKQDRLNSTLAVHEKVFPNTKVYFGKYALLTNQIYKNISFFLENSEICLRQIEECEKVGVRK